MKGILDAVSPAPPTEKKVVYKEEWLVAGHTNPKKKKKFLRHFGVNMTYRLAKARRWEMDNLGEVQERVRETMRTIERTTGRMREAMERTVGDLQPMKVTITVETL